MRTALASKKEKVQNIKHNKNDYAKDTQSHIAY